MKHKCYLYTYNDVYIIYNYYMDTHNNFNFYGSYNIYIRCTYSRKHFMKEVLVSLSVKCR